MAEKQPGRGAAHRETMSEFVARRLQEVARRGSAAEAAAYDAVKAAIRTGQDYRLMTPGEVMAFGASLTQRPKPGSDESPTTVGRPKSKSLDNNPVAKAVGGPLAYAAGLAPGVLRGGIHTVEGAVDVARFGQRLMDPLDILKSPPGQSAAEQVFNTGRAAADYAVQGVRDPSKVRDDIASAAHDFRINHDPSASPVADTVSGEMKRMFALGMNGGERVFDVGSLVLGGAALRGAAGLGRVAKAADAVELAHLAENPRLAASFRQPYPKRGMSHHIVKRTAKLPKVLGGGLYPKAFIESELNKIRHDPGMTKRDVYRNHKGVGTGRTHFEGAIIPAEFGGGGWSAKDLGWGRYGPLDRLNYGTSPYTKGLVGSALIGGELGKSLAGETP